DRADRADLVARAEALAGRPVDVLVNCAGLDALGGLLEVGADQMAELFEVNLLAPAELVRQVLPGMVARGRGHVVDVSSGFSTVSAPGLVPYSASKAGMSHFHSGMRVELRGTGVGTTLVEPGPVRTHMWDDIVEQGLASAAMRRFQRLQLAVLSDPEDVAEQTLDAVERGRRHVVLPRRMVPVMVPSWIVRRVSDLALTGVPRR
ncbi:MAG: short-chain dehydrogenase, partial [Frankiales bacterium]|nr:short-chain dehydrogenase [Frankiales bacterium]